MSAHFVSRVIKRCPDIEHPFALARQIRRAVLERDTSFAVRLMDGRGNTGLYRLFMPQGRFYAIVNDTTGTPITFLRQEEIPAIKATIRGKSTSVAAWKAQRFNRDYMHDRRHRIKRTVEAKWHRG